jgi:hypothetical protein
MPQSTSLERLKTSAHQLSSCGAESSTGRCLADELGGEPQYLRVATSEQLPPTVLPGATIPNELIRPKAQMMMHFQNGLPLAPGRVYIWRVKIDHVTRDEWTEPMYVPTFAPGPVLG